MTERINPAVSREIAAIDQALAATTDELRKAHLVRSRLSFLMSDCVQNAAKYSNSDVLDLVRDVAKAFKMQFKVFRDERQRHIIHFFVKSPMEVWDLRPGIPACAQWLGYVERSHGAGGIQGSRR